MNTDWKNFFGPLLRNSIFAALFLAAAMAMIRTPMQALELREGMFAAAQAGDVDALERSLRCGVEVDVQDTVGITPLMAAARAGRVQAVAFLLAHGANVNASAQTVGTPLILAAASDQLSVLRLLLASGADPDARNDHNFSAFDMARLYGSDACARELKSLVDRTAAANW